jgi:hypothetical protein
MSSIMYKVTPLLKELPISQAKVMYQVQPIKTVAELSKMTSIDPAVTAEAQDQVFARLDQLKSRVSTIKSVLAKAPKTTPKTDFGSKFIAKVAPLDIVININPRNCRPAGLGGLHKQLSNQFKVLTKVHIHSTATGMKMPDWFTTSVVANTNRKDYQIIFTVIYSEAVDDMTAFIGNSRLAGISSVTRFIGRILDIYPPMDTEIEKYLELADLIGDGDSAKKEKMANAKILDQHFAKNKFCCGETVSIADFAIYSAIGSIEEKTRGKSLQAFCQRMAKE